MVKIVNDFMVEEKDRFFKNINEVVNIPILFVNLEISYTNSKIIEINLDHDYPVFEDKIL